MVEASTLYAAFRSVCPVDDNGELLLPLERLADGGRGWFAIANSVKAVAEPATDMSDPYQIDLIPIPPRVAPDGGEIVESEDERPTKVTIRALTAEDLCVREYGTDRFTHAVFARALGVELDTVEWRMDISDVQGAILLCSKAGGREASTMCRDLYYAGGGKQPLDDAPDLAWIRVSQALLTEYDGDVARVRCRTPGIGTLTIGPIRAGHTRVHTGTAARENEWTGRLAALARASDRALGQMMVLRPEDAFAAWEAFETLVKKKASLQATSPIGARLSSTFTAGAGPTSKT